MAAAQPDAPAYDPYSHTQHANEYEQPPARDNAASPGGKYEGSQYVPGSRGTGIGHSSNAYASGGNQNCGNVLTDRPTSR